MSTFHFAAQIRLVFLLAMLLGCQGANPPYSQVPAEKLLLRASGACLAKIVKLEEHDDRPADGDHWLEAWLEVEQGTGEIPRSLYLVIELGELSPPELRQTQEDNLRSMVQRHDSLKVGERHWFVFSADDDPARYPPGVVGWWRYDDRDVPYDVVSAIDHDRFADHPQWDKQRDVVFTWWQNREEFTTRVREADTIDPSGVLFGKTFDGHFRSLKLAHAPFAYEIEPISAPPACHVQVEMVRALPAENSFHLPAGNYHILEAYDLDTGKLAATSISTNQNGQEIEAFRQYNLDSGQPIVEVDYQRMESGGPEVGDDSCPAGRRIVRKYDGGKLVSEQTFPLPLKTDQEPLDLRSTATPLSN